MLRKDLGWLIVVVVVAMVAGIVSPRLRQQQPPPVVAASPVLSSPVPTPTATTAPEVVQTFNMHGVVPGMTLDQVKRQIGAPTRILFYTVTHQSGIWRYKTLPDPVEVCFDGNHCTWIEGTAIWYGSRLLFKRGASRHDVISALGLRTRADGVHIWTKDGLDLIIDFSDSWDVARLTLTPEGYYNYPTKPAGLYRPPGI